MQGSVWTNMFLEPLKYERLTGDCEEMRFEKKGRGQMRIVCNLIV